MAWLETVISGAISKYSKRVKLTIDGSKIEEDLTDFPVLIKLSEDSGILNTDTSATIIDSLNTNLYVDSFTELLLHMDDINLTDSTGKSSVSKSYTIRSSTYSKFGGYSAYFDGMWAYMHPSGDYYVGSNEDYTIDFWCMPIEAASQNTCLFSLGGPAYIYVSLNSRNNIQLHIAGGLRYIAVDYFPVGVWTHIALVRNNNLVSFYINGICNFTYPHSGIVGNTACYIGWQSSYSGHFYGYMDEVRIVVGRAQWASDFTPPNVAYYNTIDDAKKIAITSADGETQQYVEVEYWDTQARNAVLWTKCPTLASGVNTDLYLYYDKDAADNDTYVGEAGSTAASNVWDYNFVGVWHMSQSPNGDATNAIKDSTTNANHLTPVGSMTDADLVDASPGKGIEFDGSNDRADKSSAAALPSSTLTYEIVAVAEPLAAVPSTGMAVVNSSSASNFISLQAYNRHVRSIQDGVLIFSGTTLLAEGVTFYAAFTRLADDERYIFTNGGNKTGNTVSMAYPSSTDRISVGGAGDLTTSYFPGVITEVRISDVVRSDAWIKSTYYSNWDDLVYFYSPAIAPTYVFEGVVSYNEATLSGVQVRLYRRSTGELIDSSSTSASGTFYLSTPFDSEDHYVIALRDYSSINAIIADWVNSSNE